MKIPLSWLQLSHEKVRFFVAIAGITFADVLMFMQLGFRDALFDSSTKMHNTLEGDIFMISSQSDSTAFASSFSRRRLYGIAGIKGIEYVTPMYIGAADWKNPYLRNTRRIFVYGINPKYPALNLPGVEQNIEKIKFPDTVLFDELSRLDFGPIASEYKQGKNVVTEVSSRKIRVGGLFSLGTSFGADGNIITSDINFLRLFPNRNPGLIDLGIIKLEEGADKDLILRTLQNKLVEGDVMVFDFDGLIAHEKNYWQTRTAVGFVFTLGTIMGFIVGIVIVYQILYTDVADHLPEYATLKAMGYTDLYLLGVVFQEAIILAFIGYLPSVSLAMLLYFGAANATGLPIAMTASKAVTVFVLTGVMCCVSGAISVGKLRAADPADIF
ncbi:MAG: ABC transporter permease DevC [Prochloraceae cyanobacterium]